MEGVHQFSQNGYRLNIAGNGVSPLEVARQIASQFNQNGENRPFFIFNADQVLTQHLKWQNSMPRIQPYYSVKCNSDPVLLRLLASFGCNFDCASKTEINSVLQINSVTPDRIIYADPCKNRSYIQYAANAGVRLMTFDNAEELYKIKNVHPQAELLIRIAVPDPTMVCVPDVKFGCEPNIAAPNLLRMAADVGVNVVGVSFHVESGCRDPTAYANGIEIARKLFDMGEEMGHHMRILDIGGGFPGVSSANITFSQIAAAVNESLSVHFPAEDSNVQIMAQPGRFYASAAFSLCCSIVAKTKVPANIVSENISPEEDGFIYYINDGVYGSFSGILFDHLYPTGLPLFDTGSDEKLSSIWGPTRDGLDIVLPECRLPEMNEGNWIIFPNMGAYSLGVANDFGDISGATINYWGSVWTWDLMNQDEPMAIEEKVIDRKLEAIRMWNDGYDRSRSSTPGSVSSEENEA